MSPRPGTALRRQVFDRAGGRCEYCLVHQSGTYITFHLDHIISRETWRIGLPGQFSLIVHAL